MPKANTQTQTHKTSELHRNLVNTAVKAGLEDNSDLSELFGELTSSDKLRGVKASITIGAKGIDTIADLQRRLLKLVIRAGITLNSDIAAVFHALVSTDKLRGVKASLTLASQKNAACKLKPCKPCKANKGCAKKTETKKKPLTLVALWLPWASK